MHSLIREKPMPELQGMNTDVLRHGSNFVCCLREPSNSSTGLSRKTIPRSEPVCRVTYVGFAYHIVYNIILAVWYIRICTHIRCLKVTEAAGPSYVIPAPHAPRTENRGEQEL